MRKVSLDTLFETADIITLHTPYNEATKNLICKGEWWSLVLVAEVVVAGRAGVMPMHAACSSGRKRAACAPTHTTG